MTGDIFHTLIKCYIPYLKARVRKHRRLLLLMDSLRTCAWTWELHTARRPPFWQSVV